MKSKKFSQQLNGEQIDDFNGLKFFLAIYVVIQISTFFWFHFEVLKTISSFSALIFPFSPWIEYSLLQLMAQNGFLIWVISFYFTSIQMKLFKPQWRKLKSTLVRFFDSILSFFCVLMQVSIYFSLVFASLLLDSIPFPWWEQRKKKSSRKTSIEDSFETSFALRGIMKN